MNRPAIFREDQQFRLLALIRKNAPAYFPDVKGDVDARVVEKRRRVYSDIYRVAITNGGGRPYYVVIKQFPEAQLQFQAMKEVWVKFAAHPTWKIPRPYDYLAEGPALVMEAVSGKSLQSRLLGLGWGGSLVKRAEADCQRAGEWLRFYHDLGRTNDFAVLDVIKGRGLEETLEELLSAQFDRDFHRQVASVLRTLAARIAHKPRPLSVVHGDFTASNILLDREHVTALDLCAKSRNTIDHDIASFLNSLITLRLTRPVPWSAVQCLRESFLKGYFGNRPRDESTIIFLQIMGLADVALEILGRRRSVLARLWLEHVVTHGMSALAKSLQKAGQ